MSPASFGVATRTPAANPTVDAMAAAIRPRDLGAAPAPVARESGWSGARKLALLCALVAHAGLVVGAAAYQRTTIMSDAAEEIPVEIVVEAMPAAIEPPAPAAQPAVAEPPPIEPAQPATVVAQDTAPETTQEVAQQAPPEPAPPPQQAAVAILPPPAIEPVAPDPALIAAQQAAERRALEAERRKREEKREEALRRREADKAEAEREKREQGRRAAEREKREQARETRQRVASLAPAARETREAPRETFDAASYRAIVARAVSAAVGRSCPSQGGGRVVVALTIGAAGQISGVSLTSASGNGALDSAAVAAVRRAGPFPAPTGRSSVSVPVAVTCR